MPEIQGKDATLPEYYLGVALAKRKILYYFQYSIWGGNRVRGGATIDFVVYNPYPIPVEVYGQYWHNQRTADDSFRMARIRQYFGREPVIITDDLLESQEEADAAVVRYIA